MPAGENAAAIATLMTILFSVVVMGWVLLYKCTDATLVPGDFAVQKCFSFIAVPKKPEVSNVSTVEETTDLLSGASTKGSILQVSGVGDEDDGVIDPDSYKYLDEFNEMDTKLTSSNAFVDISATDIYNCAKICANVEVQVGAAGCGGFTSEYDDPTPDDRRVTCRLYEKGHLRDSKIFSGTTTSFYLKTEEEPA
jgi:hypothetical protein